MPNVDVDYECEEENEEPVNPTVTTADNVKITGRKIVEFGRPGVNTYFGIPYARAPVEQYRFQRPVKLDDVSPVDAGLYKSECVRYPQGLEHSSEDCLYLDVWQPLSVNERETKWTIIYLCDGYISLYGTAGTAEDELELPPKCRNWMGYFTEDHDVISIHISYSDGFKIMNCYRGVINHNFY